MRQDAVARLLQLDIDDNHPSGSELDYNEAEFNNENGKTNSYYTGNQTTLNPLQNNPEFRDFTTKKSCQESANIPTNLTFTINLNTGTALDQVTPMLAVAILPIMKIKLSLVFQI